MKEFIEKLIGMLEELYARNDKTKKMAYEEKDWEKFDLFTHRCEGIYSAISIVNQLAEEYNNDICEWKQHEREIDVYFTECGQAHIFVDGNPEENNHVFCPYCGKKIKVAPYQSKGE